MLTQPQEDKVNVFQCGSTTLSSAQCGYSTVELEMLSVVWSLEKCDYYLRGAHDVVAFTHHAPLVGDERRDLSSIGNQRLVRMIKKTRGYCLELRHICGAKNMLLT